MPLLRDLLTAFLDTLTGHLALTAYLMAVTDEQAVWRRLKRLPPLLLSSLAAALLSVGLTAVPELGALRYLFFSFVNLSMCTLWVWWAWQFSFWRAAAATCMAGIFQVAGTTLSGMIFWISPPEGRFRFTAALGVHLCISVTAALLLYRLRFGRWFRLLLDNESALRRTALLLFALEAVMEVFFCLLDGVQRQYWAIYYLLMMVMAILMSVLMVYLAKQFDAARKVQFQRDVIAQQQLYEQDLESIRREARAFRHDYKNLLAGLSQQAEAGELEELRHTLSALDAGFDRRIGRKIQVSTQIGNLQISEVRSLLLSKLTIMREQGVECRLEVLYPLENVGMDIWDFVRCLGVLVDNAMEAAQDTEQPWVEIVLLAQGGRVFLRVSNSYANDLDPVKMWDESWSTKGPGRGVGLSSYRHILENYPNASPCTSWEGGVFVQELSVEGRP